MLDTTYVQLVKLYCKDSKRKEVKRKKEQAEVIERTYHPELDDLTKKILKQTIHDLRAEMINKIKLKSTIDKNDKLLYNMYETEIEAIKAQIQYLKN